MRFSRTTCEMKGCESVTAPAILTVASWKSTTPAQASVASRLRASTAPCGRSSVRRPGIRESPYLTTMTPMKSMPIVVAIFRKREEVIPIEATEKLLLFR